MQRLRRVPAQRKQIAATLGPEASSTEQQADNPGGTHSGRPPLAFRLEAFAKSPILVMAADMPPDLLAIAAPRLAALLQRLRRGFISASRDLPRSWLRMDGHFEFALSIQDFLAAGISVPIVLLRSD